MDKFNRRKLNSGAEKGKSEIAHGHAKRSTVRLDDLERVRIRPGVLPLAVANMAKRAGHKSGRGGKVLRTPLLRATVRAVLSGAGGFNPA